MLFKKDCLLAYRAASAENALGKQGGMAAQVAKQRELRLIENQHLLRDAPIQHRATAL